MTNPENATGKKPVEIDSNTRTGALADALAVNADVLRLRVSTLDGGARVIDAGVDVTGGLEAGCRIAEICMAGLGAVRITSKARFARWPLEVEVTTSAPVVACLASQYAGWSLEAPMGEKTFRAMASGPGRAVSVREPLFAELGLRDPGARATLVLEASKLPPAALAEKVSAQCGIGQEDLTLVVTPTGSLAGVVQIAARVVEVALHKAHELHFDLDAIVDAAGHTPLPPPIADGLAAMGRTNDTILFAGYVHLFVTGPDDAAEQLAQQLPSGASRDYGKPFAQVFADYEYDFFKIDPMLFSPAQVAVTAVESGRTFFAGQSDEPLLDRSFGG